MHPTNLHQLQDAILLIWANIYPINMGQHLKNAFSTLLNQCHVELRQF